VFFFVLHRANHVPFCVFEEDERADGWNMKLGHDDLAAVGFNRRIVSSTESTPIEHS